MSTRKLLNEIYEVERIDEKRTNNNKIEYLVKWLGYSES